MYKSCMNIKHAAKEVRFRREAMGLSQRQLAKNADVSHQTVVNLEAEIYDGINTSKLIPILRALGLDLGIVVSDAE